MKKFIGLLLALYLLTFLFGADTAEFPDIYIDEGVGGTHVGSIANPYDDFADINWTTGGDNSIFDWYAGAEDASVTINLMEGDEWREELIVGTSGSAAYPIIIRSYGSDVKPIINGADLVITWTEDLTWETAFTNPCDDAEDSLDEDYNVRNVIGNGNLAFGGDKVRLTFKGHSGSAGQIDGASIGLPHGVNPEDFIGPPTRITFGTNDFGVLPAGGTLESDEITFTLDDTKDHLVHIFMDTGNADFSSETAGMDGCYRVYDASVDNTLTENIAGYQTGAGECRVLSKIEVESGAANVWKATFTRGSAPAVVWFDGVAGTKQASAAACTGAREWFWAANVLYVYSVADPDGAYISPGIEASNRIRCIYSEEDKDYITVEDLCLIHANGTGLNFQGFGGDIPQYIIIDNCTLRDNGSFGILVFECQHVLIKNCTVYNCVVEEGIYINSEAASRSDDTIIENCEVYDNFENGILLNGEGVVGVLNVIVRYNYLHGNGYTGEGNGIQISDCNGVDVYYNQLYDNGLREIVAGAEDASFSQNVDIYNNSVVNVTDSSYAVIGNIGCTVGINIKNNIIVTLDDDVTLIKDTTGDATIDNNCYYSTGNYNNAWHWDGTDYDTFADWKTNSGQDANAINVNPYILDAANGDFRLLMASLCINAGTDVGLTRDYRGRSIRHAPDIGAYEDPTSAIFMARLFKYLKEKK